MQTTEVTRTLARFVADTPADAIPGAARERAAVALLDWMGVTLAAADLEPARLIRRSTSPFWGPAQARLIGCDQSVDAVHAALINGFMSHLHDFDDVDMQWIGHPGVTVIPAVLAAAEWQSLSGKALLDALLIGLQVQNRIGTALMPDYYVRGHHSTATIGGFGAAAGVARLLGLTAEQTAMALGIVSTQSAGMRIMFGTMCKPLHPGRAASTGLLSAVLAHNGFTSHPEAIETKAGFAELLSRDFDPEVAVVNLTSDWAVDQIEFKDYPSCRSTHGSIDAILALRPRIADAITDITAISITINERAAMIANRINPATNLEAKFCQHYCMAVALLDGRVGLSQFESARLADPRVQDLMGRTRVAGDQSLTYGAARLGVEFADGRKIDFSFDERKPDPSRDAERITRKFNDLLTDSGIPAQPGLAEQILNIGSRNDIGSLLAQFPTTSSGATE